MEVKGENYYLLFPISKQCLAMSQEAGPQYTLVVQEAKCFQNKSLPSLFPFSSFVVDCHIVWNICLVILGKLS